MPKAIRPSPCSSGRAQRLARPGMERGVVVALVAGLVAAAGVVVWVSRSATPSALSNTVRVVDRADYQVAIDTAWIVAPGGAPSLGGSEPDGALVCRVGTEYTLEVSLAAPGGRTLASKRDLPAFLSQFAGSGFGQARLDRWEIEDLGSYRWRHASFSLASGGPERLDVWTLELPSGELRFAFGSPGQRDAVHASAMASLRSLKTRVEPLPVSRPSAQTPLRGLREQYEFLVPESWAALEHRPDDLVVRAAGPRVDRCFEIDSVHTLIVRVHPDVFRGGASGEESSILDAALSTGALGVETDAWAPALTVPVQGTEWLTTTSDPSRRPSSQARTRWFFRYDARVYDLELIRPAEDPDPELWDHELRRVVESFRVPPVADDPMAFEGPGGAYRLSVPRAWAEVCAAGADRAFELDESLSIRVRSRPLGTGEDAAGVRAGMDAAAGDRPLRWRSVELGDARWEVATTRVGDGPTEERWIRTAGGRLYEIELSSSRELGADSPERASVLAIIRSLQPAP